MTYLNIELEDGRRFYFVYGTPTMTRLAALSRVSWHLQTCDGAEMMTWAKKFSFGQQRLDRSVKLNIR